MKTIKLGVVCEFGKNCGLVSEKHQHGTRICNGEHTLSDYVEGKEYTSVIEVPKIREHGYIDRSKLQ